MIDRGFSLKTQNWSSLVFKLDEKLECYTIILDLFDNLASRAGEQSQNWKAEILTNQPSTRKIVILTDLFGVGHSVFSNDQRWDFRVFGCSIQYK